MRTLFQFAWLFAIAVGALHPLIAQDLAPRAYVLTPLHANALTLTYGFYDGSLLFNGAIPITNATGNYNVPVISLYHSFDMFGHFANVTASLPYAVGTFQGDLKTEAEQIYRSGLVDSTYRLAVNLKGGPPLEPAEFHKWKQKTIIGVSLKVIAPTGQYDPAKVINWGGNRGRLSRRWAIRSVGAKSYWMLTAVFGSTRSIPAISQDTISRGSNRSGLLRATLATTGSSVLGYRWTAISGSAASPV